jgi:ABC-type glutathione transport system ATPase component
VITGRATPSSAERHETALAVDHLSKRFADRVAFDDVSFEVGRGEVFGFLGPNGAGKTTTVRTLGTLIAPTSGSAVVAGYPLTPENGVEIRRRIAVMPESPGLYLRLSVMENLACFADLCGGRASSANRRRLGRSTWRTEPRPLWDLVEGLRQRSPWRGRCSAIRRSSSSTSRRPGSIRSPRAMSTSSSSASVSGG